MTYRVGKEQFVAIMGAGKTRSISHAKRGRIVAFKIGGGPVPHPPDDDDKETEAPPIANNGTPEQIELGAQLFASHCAMCHLGGQKAPLLPQMSPATHRQFDAIGAARSTAKRRVIVRWLSESNNLPETTTPTIAPRAALETRYGASFDVPATNFLRNC